MSNEKKALLMNYPKILSFLALMSVLLVINCSKKKSSSGEVESAIDGYVPPTIPNPSKNDIPSIKKSSIETTVTGSLALDSVSFGLSSGLNLANPLEAGSTLKCVDAIDDSVLDSGVIVGEDGSFTCEGVPQCYDESSCAQANPVQVEIYDESSEKLICIATAGASGLICDVAGCFAAAQAEISPDSKQCLTSVNMVAASDVFQDSLNKAFKLGQVPLDRYTLSQCIGMTTKEKFSALKTMTRGTVVEVVLDSLGNQLDREIARCSAAAGGEAVSVNVMESLRDITTIGFAILLGGSTYDQDLADANSAASQITTIVEEVKQIRLAIANNCDPITILDGAATGVCASFTNKFSEGSFKYKYAIGCSYTGDGEAMVIDRKLNSEKTDWQSCSSTYTHEDMGTLDLSGISIGAKLNFPDINDPQGIHNNREDEGGIPFEYVAFKAVLENFGKLYSLQDIYEVFFTDTAGLNFRMQAYIDDYEGSGQEYIISGDNQATSLQENNRQAYLSASYAPSFDQVFNFITNKDHAFNLDKLIQMKFHRPYNPTGQEFFYVSGKELSNKNVPVTCDILDASGHSAGINILPGITANCIATSNSADMKRFFINNSSNQAFVSLISKNSGNEIRTSEGAPIFLQNINVSPGQNMPTCTTANQVSIFTYKKSGEYDQWLDGVPLKTVCYDFSTIKNAAEYYVQHHQEVTIGNNNWSTSVIGGGDENGEVHEMCLDASTLTTSEVVGCFNQAGIFSSCASAADCNCDWQTGEFMREFTNLTSPGAGSLALDKCESISGSKYYLANHWEPGNKNSLSDIKVALVDSSDGQRLESRNTAFDPSIVGTYISAAFAECKTSSWCWRKDDISELGAYTEIPADESWMKDDIVRWYCHENAQSSMIRSNCEKLEPSESLTLTLDKFSNIGSMASVTDYEIYKNDSYFSHMQQPNPNYNKIFDYESFTFKYSNYDPYCDDVNNSGGCDFGSQAEDVYFSDIWRFNPEYALFAPVDGIAETTFDSSNSLFPAEPADWNSDWGPTYIDPVYHQIGGPSALACSNDRSIKLSWDNMHFWEDSTWRTSQEDSCGNSNGYYIVRNIVPNANTYLLGQPDYIQALMRIGFGTLDKRSISASEKRFDVIQALAVFMVSMEVPPIVVDSRGRYIPLFPIIGGKTYLNSSIRYSPINYQGELKSLMDQFDAK